MRPASSPTSAVTGPGDCWRSCRIVRAGAERGKEQCAIYDGGGHECMHFRFPFEYRLLVYVVRKRMVC